MLYDTQANRQIVVCACGLATRMGVRPEMTLAHARALLHHRTVLARPHDPGRDAEALRALAIWAQRFSPLVALDPPNGLLLDIGGCERLFHGERALLHRVIGDMRRLGLTVQAAVASTFGCAWAMARAGAGADGGVIVPDGRERETLAELPVEMLRLDPATIEALREVDLDRIGHVLDLPRGSVAARFGDDLLMRLDQALGLAMEPVDPIRVEPPLEAQRVFDGPCTQLAAILLTVRELISMIVTQLRRRESGALRLDVIVHRVHASPLRQVLSLSHPARDEGHLWALLRPRVETIDLGFGVERVSITALPSRVTHEQASRWSEPVAERAEGERQLGRFVDAVAGRCGPRGAVRPELVASHVPERAYRLEPVRAVRSRRIAAEGVEPDLSPWPRVVVGTNRPTLLLPEPRPIEVIALAAEGPPAWIRWPRGSTAIVTSLGPERIAGEWWRAGRRPTTIDGTRDYYAVQDEQGRWLWIFRHHGSGAWFVHGQWA